MHLSGLIQVTSGLIQVTSVEVNYLSTYELLRHVCECDSVCERESDWLKAHSEIRRKLGRSCSMFNLWSVRPERQSQGSSH